MVRIIVTIRSRSDLSVVHYNTSPGMPGGCLAHFLSSLLVCFSKPNIISKGWIQHRWLRGHTVRAHNSHLIAPSLKHALPYFETSKRDHHSNKVVFFEVINQVRKKFFVHRFWHNFTTPCSRGIAPCWPSQMMKVSTWCVDRFDAAFTVSIESMS